MHAHLAREDEVVRMHVADTWTFISNTHSEEEEAMKMTAHHDPPQPDRGCGGTAFKPS